MLNLPNAKELRRLAAACRKAGITKFKQGDLELTISEDAPAKVVKLTTKSASSVQDTVDNDGDWESLSDEAKLLWSVGGDQAQEERAE